jgi:diaminohydroxyphosphoribosylaminopyrimidine deaminase/5-amino-6-(5-phosphoribosylamino)uracil reductase
VNTDEKYMQRAMDLAWNALGRNSPNPLVGCVIVRDDRIIAEGFHEFKNVDHAEIVALKKAGDDAMGASIYVTLEPCSHAGRTPPCADAIKKSGVKKVVYGMTDPNPLVDGKGHEILAEAGIEVTGGVLDDEIREQNRFFVTVQEKSRPYVCSKWAMSADGKIATHSGDSFGISSLESNNITHHLRNIYDAILVGHNTVLMDDPKLTSRVNTSIPLPDNFFPTYPVDTRNPVRVIVDTFASICAHELKLFDQPGKTIVAASVESEFEDQRSMKIFDEGKAELLNCPMSEGRVDIEFLLGKLVGMGINSVFIEGGSEIHSAFLEKNFVDEVAVIISPKIVGGAHSPTPVGGRGVEKIAESWRIDVTQNFFVGDDVWITGRIKY